VVRLAARVPGAVAHLPAPPWTAVAAYGTALALGLLAWRRRESASGARPLGAAATLLLGVAVALAAWPVLRPGDGRLRVTVLDVGQGDAIVVETPDRRAILVDAGVGGSLRLDVGERVVAPFLWNRGFLRLAAVLATHGDADHVGGLPAVRRLFPVAADWSDEEPPGRRWLGGVMFTTSVAAGAASRNDAALLLRLELGLASFLLASDITARAEGSLVAGGSSLRATVLKVPHHGARGSSSAAFLRAVRPDVAVISVGARNGYGHPAPETLGRLAAAGATVYRTDRDGAVTVETDGRGLTVTTWATGRVDRYCLDPEAIC
jgi:competence protein ComEC